MLMEGLKMLEGKKSYIVAFIGASIALAQAFGVDIPPVVLQVLGFLGIASLKSAIAKV